jgi:hydrolase family protein
MTVQLRYISIPALIGAAGGDPWAVSQTLQAGRPAQINALASAFHSAGRSTAEADANFDQARRRFEAAWTHENGENPINDSVEVQRTAQALGAQSEQLPKIGGHLEEIAAALAEAQKGAKGEIATLEAELHGIDEMIALAVDMEKDPKLSAADRDALNTYIGECEEQAINVTKSILDQVHSLRDTYSKILQHGQSTLATDGYDPARVWGADGHEAETPDSAEHDVHNALAGDKGAAARVNGVLGSITPDQVAGKVPLNAEQASVLSQLQAQENGMSTYELQRAEERLGDGKGMIGDSWQLMSNPKLSFPKTPLSVGAKQGSETVKGGFGQLPQSVQDTLNWNYSPDGPLHDRIAAVAKIVGDGNPGLQHGTEVDKAMLDWGARELHEELPNGQIMDHSALHGDRAILDNVFSAAGRDHLRVTDLVTGSGHDQFLSDVTRNRWDDGGKAIGSLFSWTENASGPEAEIAGRTANSYATYLGQHAGDLLKIPDGFGHVTLGQANPVLVQSFAHGLAPYIPNIAGEHNDLSRFFGVPDSAGNQENDSWPVAKGIFSVLSTDKSASDWFNGAADRDMIQAQSRFAQAVGNHVPDLINHDEDLKYAARLKGLVDVGTYNASNADAIAAYDLKKSAYEALVKGGPFAVGALPVPGAGIVGGGAGLLGSAMEHDIVGAQPTTPAIPDLPHAAPPRLVLDGFLASGQPLDGLGSEFYRPVDPQHPAGPMRIATYAEMPQGWRDSNPIESYDSDLSSALSRTLGNDTVTRVDDDISTYYNNIVHNPTPWKK